MFKNLDLIVTTRTDVRLLNRMNNHYSQPGGFVGRSICYAIYYLDSYYGHIVGGSATRFLPNRNEFFGIKNDKELNKIVNNIFYSISPINIYNKYPCRNFTTKVLQSFQEIIIVDWEEKYGDKIVGFETLVEKPRVGDLYLKAGWKKVGETIGYTCKRIGGKGTDSWSGKRVWDVENLRPKNVLCFKI